MAVLADTNILLRFTNAQDPQHETVRDAVLRLISQGKPIFYTQQSRREFWNVSTRPTERNGLGCTAEEVQQRLAEVDAVFTACPIGWKMGSSGIVW